MSSAETCSTLPPSNPSPSPASYPTTDSSQSQTSTFDTQPFPSQDDPEATIPDNTWGQLTIIDGGHSIDLVNDSYIIGRGNDCHYQMKPHTPPTKKLLLWKSCSKHHFKIYREMKSYGTFTFLEDLSSNGTLVNNQTVGRGKFTVINNGDVVSLVKKDYRAFLFTECNAVDVYEDIPFEVKGRFMFIKELGKGAFGSVRLVIRRSDKLRLACKCIDKPSPVMSVDFSKDLMKEADILKKLDHPCIIKVVAVVDTVPALFILMDLVEGGDLLQAITAQQRFEPEHTKQVFYQTCLAVQYLHKHNVVHRDLKPENILLSSSIVKEQVVKVTDFGYSVMKATSSLFHTLCGTSLYLAPEIVNIACLAQQLGERDPAAGYTKAVDCWSLGVILYVCTTGQTPFTPQRTDMPFAQQVLQGNFQLKEKYWEDLDTAKDLVRGLLTVDPNHRLTIDDTLRHSYFQDEDMKKQVHALLSDEIGDEFEEPILSEPSPDVQQPSSKKRRVDNPSPTDSAMSTSSSFSNEEEMNSPMAMSVTSAPSETN